MKELFIFLLASLMGLSFPGCLHSQIVSAPAAPVSAGVPMPAMDFNALRQDFFNKSLDFKPEFASNLGLHQYDGRLSDISPRRIAAQVEYLESVEQRLAELEPEARAQGAQSQIDHSVIVTIARSQLHELRDVKGWQKDVAAAREPYAAIQARLSQLQAGPEAAAAFEDILSLSEQLPAYLAQLRENLRQGMREGRRPARRTVEADGLDNGVEAAKFFSQGLQAQARGFLSAEDYARLSPRFENAGRIAGQAYAEHLSFLKDELLPVADGPFGIGAQEYAWKLKNEMGIQESPEELQQKGLELAAGIRKRMEELARRIDPSKDLPGVMADIKADHPKDDAELFRSFEKVADRARDFVISKGLFALPAGYKLKIIPTPEGMRATLGSAAYFPAPAFDEGKQGTFLVTPSGGDAKKLAVHNNSKLATTAVHEAFPGHDLQFWSFQHSPGISPVRYLLELAGYAFSLNAEGYAHYAEELMRKNGFYTPKEELAQLAAQLWRAWRIVLDVALHTGAMSVDQVAEALTREAFLPAPQAAVEAYRYTQMPLQAITYLLGRIQIEQLKEDYKAAQGERYSESEFHRLFLGFGPVLPSAIRSVMLGENNA
ncbi:MAG: DUF885 domain-containing protein [Elusimicrobiota bacterium]